jgi:predicted metalloprotease with PDZ domain
MVGESGYPVTVRRRVAAKLLPAALVCASLAVAQQAPLLRLQIRPSQVDAEAGKAVVDVVMTVENMKVAAGQPLLTHQNMAPNMTGPMIALDLSASDDQGPVPLVSDEKVGTRTWTSTRDVKGVLTVRYRRPIDNGHLGSLSSVPHVDGQGVFGVNNMLFLTPRTTGRYRVAQDWDLSAMAAGSIGVSTLGEGNVTTAPMLLSRMTFAMFMAGPIKRAPDPPRGAFSAVWTGEPTFDVRAAMDWTSKLHDFMSAFFADPVQRPYYVFLRAHPGGNGVAAAQAFVLGYSPKTTVESVQYLLGHEMTHTWTAADMPKWYAEGNAVYYQTLLPFRAGMMPIEKRLADINLTAARYYTSDVLDAPDSDILPKFWSDMRYNVLPYDRGAIYFAVLDGKIRRASGGKRSVDDLVRAMVALDRDEKPVSEETWVGLLRKELGEEGPAIHRAMMTGQKLIPESEDYGPCFRRISVKIPRYDLGFGGPEITRRSVVENPRPDSNAAKAGLKEGDRVQYQSSTDGAQRDPNMTLIMQVTRDGKTFSVTYLPRGELRDAYQWERIPSAPEKCCK